MVHSRTDRGEDRADALHGYRANPQDLDYGGIIYYAPAELRQAEILDRMGNHAEAAHHYARFVHLWRDAEPELRPVVQRAEERLAQLRSHAAAAGAAEQPGVPQSQQTAAAQR